MKSAFPSTVLGNRVHHAREHAHKVAIDNLARYKFSNFGYWAAKWVMLNQLIGDKAPNPFQQLVKTARELRGKGESRQ
jgi:hypothetical protein